MPTKSQQVASLLMRPEGCTYADALAVTGWVSISIQWHAKNNGLRLKTEQQPQQPKRYFGFKPKIVIRPRSELQQLPLPLSSRPVLVVEHKRPVPSANNIALANFCADHGLKLAQERGKKVARCMQCGVGYSFSGSRIPAVLVSRVKQHVQVHARVAARLIQQRVSR